MTRAEFDRAVCAAMPLLRAVAHERVRDWELAKDIAQEAAIRALSNRHAYVPRKGVPFRSWLARICINQAYSHHRRYKVKKRSGAALSIDELPTDDMVRYVRIEPNQERKILVEQAMAILYARWPEWAPYFAMIVDGAQYDEVAEAAGVPVGTIRSRLNRTRAMLREAVA